VDDSNVVKDHISNQAVRELTPIRAVPGGQSLETHTRHESQPHGLGPGPSSGDIEEIRSTSPVDPQPPEANLTTQRSQTESLHNSQSPSREYSAGPSDAARQRQRVLQAEHGIATKSPWDITNDDPYTSPAAGPVFAGLFLHTLTTLIVVAWYIGYAIIPSTTPGVVAGLAMAGLLLTAAIVPYWEEFRRLATF
jgi:hypothetical protein